MISLFGELFLVTLGVELIHQNLFHRGLSVGLRDDLLSSLSAGVVKLGSRELVEHPCEVNVIVGPVCHVDTSALSESFLLLLLDGLVVLGNLLGVLGCLNG